MGQWRNGIQDKTARSLIQNLSMQHPTQAGQIVCAQVAKQDRLQVRGGERAWWSCWSRWAPGKCGQIADGFRHHLRGAQARVQQALDQA